MFTGLVETMGVLKGSHSTAGGRRLVIELGRVSEGAKRGDSICVNGVCLTVSELKGTVGEFDVMAETVRSTTLESLRVGEKVNLERAMAMGDRFGGHIVQGHVDGVGVVDEAVSRGGEHVLWVSAEAKLIKLMIEKGSVAIEGVSLTVIDVEARRFSVGLIPTTLAETNLGARKKGDRVNLEADVINKWIVKRLDQMLSGGKSGGVTVEKLREQGFE